MGKSPKPLTIWIHPSLVGNPLWVTMIAQGHTVLTVDEAPDLIVGPNCWRIVEGLEEYIPIAVDAARKRRYPTKKGTKDGGVL